MAIPSRWLIVSYVHSWAGNTILISCTTDNPCHLYLHHTDRHPTRAKLSDWDGGIGWMTRPRWAASEFTTVDQQQPGDTTTHTFSFDGWTPSSVRWWAITGTIAGAHSPSASPIMHDRSPP